MKNKFLIATALCLSFSMLVGCGMNIHSNDFSFSNKGVTDKIEPDSKTVTKNINLESEINTINHIISIGEGNVTIKGGSQDAVNAKFIYNIPSWAPEISNSASGNIQNISISQPHNKNISNKSSTYIWDLTLNKNTSSNLTLNMGAGKVNADLRDINLKDLNVQSGVGEFVLDISGDYKQSINAKIKGGVGDITLYIPKNIGTNVSVSKGLGEVKCDSLTKTEDGYKNDSYGKTSNSINIDVETGVGSVTIEEK